MSVSPQAHLPTSLSQLADMVSVVGAASDFAKQAQDRFADTGEAVKTVVKNRPVLALGAALAAGVFLGWLIKRR